MSHIYLLVSLLEKYESKLLNLKLKFVTVHQELQSQLLSLKLIDITLRKKLHIHKELQSFLNFCFTS